VGPVARPEVLQAGVHRRVVLVAPAEGGLESGEGMSECEHDFFWRYGEDRCMMCEEIMRPWHDFWCQVAIFCLLHQLSFFGRWPGVTVEAIESDV
jgi:hypothetical protein